MLTDMLHASIFRFHKGYFIITMLLLITEVLIATYAHDQFVRPFVGDVLVVILIYCFLQSFLKLPVFPTAMAVLLFAFMIETLQYFQIVYLLGLGNSKIARIMIGTSFEWTDLLAYTIGIGLVLLILFILRAWKFQFRKPS